MGDQDMKRDSGPSACERMIKKMREDRMAGPKSRRFEFRRARAVRDDGMAGWIMHAMAEGPSHGWKQVLALVDDQGRWLYSQAWRSNAYRQAIREVEELGYRIQSIDR